MIYSWEFSSPANGSASAPVQELVKLSQGLVYEFELYFPPGSSGLLHVWVQAGAHPMWPATAGEDFAGDNILVHFADRQFLERAENTLSIYHYNLDDTYDHLFRLSLGVVSAELFVSSFLPGQVFGGLTDMLAQTSAAQEEERELRRARIELITGPAEG